jgi:hypothetical protein
LAWVLAALGSKGPFVTDKRDEWERTFAVSWFGTYSTSARRARHHHPVGVTPAAGWRHLLGASMCWSRIEDDHP